MRDLPRGWAWATLDEVGDYINGRAFSKSEWTGSGRPIIRIQNLTGTSTAFNHYSGPLDEKYVVRQGDLLVSWAATLAVHVWDDPREGALNQHIFKVRPWIDPGYLRFYLKSVLSSLTESSHGSGIMHVTRGRFGATTIPVPPMREQRRIASAIENHTSSLDRSGGLIDSSIVRLEKLRESMMQAWLSPSPTQELVINLLKKRPSNGRSVPTATTDGFPVLRLTALHGSKVDLTERKLGAWSDAQAKSYLVKKGDVLLSRGNGSINLVGRAALVADDPDDVAYPDTIVRLTPNTDMVDSRFLVGVWNSRIVREQIEAAARTTAGIYKINQKVIEKIRLPLPPLYRQQEIVAQLEDSRRSFDQLRIALESTRSRTSSLHRSLLDAAFSGDLVEPDPDDEPADALLARISSERAAITPSKKPRTRPSRKATTA